MIVADTNLIAYLFFQGEHSDLAVKVLAKDNEWFSPILWRSEFLSILMKKIRFEQRPYEEMQSILSDAVAFMQHSEVDPDPRAVLEIIYQSNLSSYDSEFIALAQQLHAPLITSDGKMLRAFPSVAISPEVFLNYTPQS